MAQPALARPLTHAARPRPSPAGAAAAAAAAARTRRAPPACRSRQLPAGCPAATRGRLLLPALLLVLVELLLLPLLPHERGVDLLRPPQQHFVGRHGLA